MANIREAEIKCPFYCLVTNTMGMYWGKVRVEGDKPNQKAWRIAYIPLKHAKKALVSGTLSNISPKKYVELTNVKYPDSGVAWPFSPRAEPTFEGQPGRFNQVVLGLEDTNGNSFVGDRIESLSTEKNAELERENRRLRQQLSHEEIEKLELEHKEDEKSDNPRSRRRQGMEDRAGFHTEEDLDEWGDEY